jgi:hypothetical protein
MDIVSCSWHEFLDEPTTSCKKVAREISDPRVSAALLQQCEEAGIKPLSVRAPSAVEIDELSLGEGALLSLFVTLTSNIRVW